jgi:hypothetical protein
MLYLTKERQVNDAMISIGSAVEDSGAPQSRPPADRPLDASAFLRINWFWG